MHRVGIRHVETPANALAHWIAPACAANLGLLIKPLPVPRRLQANIALGVFAELTALCHAPDRIVAQRYHSRPPRRVLFLAQEITATGSYRFLFFKWIFDIQRSEIFIAIDVGRSIHRRRLKGRAKYIFAFLRFLAAALFDPSFVDAALLDGELPIGDYIEFAFGRG